MKNLLYVDREFKNSLGGDKNRSRYLYKSLQKSRIVYTCIVKDFEDSSEAINATSSLELVSSKKINILCPQAILYFSRECKNLFVAYIQEHNIQTLFFRTIAFSSLALYAKEKIPTLKIIIDVDLILSRLMKQSWEKNKSFQSRYYYIQMLKLLKYEKRLYKNDFTFLFSNKNECLQLNEEDTNPKFQYLPNTTDIKPKKPFLGEKNIILLYGSMDSTANRDAYNYINEEVYDAIECELERNNYEIHIVGKGCDTLPVTKHKRIKIIGEVESIESVILQSSFVVLPLFIASGTNTRVIETAMAGRALITTTLGIEGFAEQKNYTFIANTLESMCSTIKKMMTDKEYCLSSAGELQQEILSVSSYEVFEDTLENILRMQEKISLMHVPRRFTQNSWGGTETVVMSSAKNLSTLGYTSSIYTSKALDENSIETMDSTLIKRFDYFYPFFGLSTKQKNNFDAIGGNLFSFSLLWALLKNKNIDLIHLHTLKRMGAIVRSVAKYKNIPYVITLHGGYFNISEGEQSHRKKQLENGYEWGKVLGWMFGSRKVLDDASAIITLSDEEYDKASQLYGDKTYNLSNGVDIEKFSQATSTSFKKHYMISADKKMILCSARIDTQKNQLVLLKAFSKLYDKQKDLHLVLLGAVSDTEYFELLQEFIDKHDLKDCISFIHDLTPKDQLLVNAYNEAEMLVLPSRHEPFGMVILEAWSANIPVVASLTGGIGKIIR
ncbi:MAG: glycosyltransferase involved in cell wall biosynthesis, partial [Sulfurimonas sp.]|uniref:glycosyltransferase n=1 Tax=Sulfurimonas sp. TaxID=2022749 RepID=UPI0039E566F7